MKNLTLPAFFIGGCAGMVFTMIVLSMVGYSDCPDSPDAVVDTVYLADPHFGEIEYWHNKAVECERYSYHWGIVHADSIAMLNEQIDSLQARGL